MPKSKKQKQTFEQVKVLIEGAYTATRNRILSFLRLNPGATNDQIARELNLAPLTVGRHLSDLLGKDLRGVRAPEKLVRREKDQFYCVS